MWAEEHTAGGPAGAYTLCCEKGKICLPPLQPPPQLFADLFGRRHPTSAAFLRNIRSYNVQLQMASTGVATEYHNPAPGPQVYKIGGAVHHRIGSLMPLPGMPQTFAQVRNKQQRDGHKE
jgi:hypothetical protein